MKLAIEFSEIIRGTKRITTFKFETLETVKETIEKLNTLIYQEVLGRTFIEKEKNKEIKLLALKGEITEQVENLNILEKNKKP